MDIFYLYIKNRFKWHFYPRLHHVSKFPSHIDIELSSLCNLSCPMCYTTTDEFKQKINQKEYDLNYLKNYQMRLHNTTFIQFD